MRERDEKEEDSAMNVTKKRAALTAGLLALALALGLGGCGEDSAPATPEEVLAKAQQTMDGVKSLGYDMTMEMSMGMAGQSLEMSTVTTADTILSPLTMKAEMAVDMGDLGSTNMTMYVKEENGSYLTATGIPDADGTVTWETASMDSLSQLESLDGKASMDLYLTSAFFFDTAATETVEGVEATRYDGVISGEKLEEVLEASGVLSQMEGLGLGDVTTMFSGLGDLPVSIWVAKETYYPIKYEMDMAEMMQSILENALKQEMGMDVGLTLDKMSVSMVLRDFDQVGEIEIPDGVFAG